MKLNDVKLLYVCNDFPYPPMHGGLVDMWNRIQTLHSMGVQVDVVVTARTDPPDAYRSIVEKQVRRLIISKRKPTREGLLSYKPAQVAIRNHLRNVKLNDDYDAVLMQSEFTTEILKNKTLRFRKTIIRVDNDEVSYYMKIATDEPSYFKKLYYLQEALRIKWHSSKMLSRADMLWFISHDELTRYQKTTNPKPVQQIAFIPAAIDIQIMSQLPLKGSRILFVGNLWNQLNRTAIEWYVHKVHADMNRRAGYKLVIVGSTSERDCKWIKDISSSFDNIEISLNQDDLTQFYKSSAVFINPMQNGAGVKLKTIEAALRGLPIVSTRVGAEGSGFIDGIHFKCADTAAAFSLRINEFLEDKYVANSFVQRSQAFLREYYDQTNALMRAIESLSIK